MRRQAKERGVMEKVGLTKADHALTCYSTALQNAFRRAAQSRPARALGALQDPMSGCQIGSKYPIFHVK
jgi:hypothetical protein